MKNRLKFAALQGVLAVAAMLSIALSFGIPGSWFRSHSDSAFLLRSFVGGSLIALGPYLASKVHWLSFPVSLRRALFSAAPLLFVGVAFFLGTIGWGDLQEHAIRGGLHLLHRELADQVVGTSRGRKDRRLRLPDGKSYCLHYRRTFAPNSIVDCTLSRWLPSHGWSARQITSFSAA